MKLMYLLLLACGHVSSSGNQLNSLQFLFFGDWGLPGSNLTEVVGTMSQLKNVSFLVALGDNFYESGVYSTDDPKWNSIYTDNFLNIDVPIYAVLGNHDYRQNPDAQIQYAEQNLDPKGNWRMPGHDYSVIYKIPDALDSSKPAATLQIVFVDTCILAPMETLETTVGPYAVSEEDITAHLVGSQSVLAASTATWLIVAGHHPIFSRGEHGDTAALQARLLPILQKYGVHAYLNGHDHTLQHISWQGLEFFTSGRGSYSAANNNPPGYWGRHYDTAQGEARFGSLTVGFGVVSVTDDVMKVSFRDRYGNLLYSTKLTNPRPSASFYVASLPAGQISHYWSRTGQDLALFLLGLLVGVAASNSNVQRWLSSLFRRICCCLRCLWPEGQGVAGRSSLDTTTSSSSTSAKADFSGSLTQFELQDYSPMSLREDMTNLHDEDAFDQKERFV